MNLSKSTYLNIAKTGLYYLVSNTGKLSWLQLLFLKKCRQIYPDIVGEMAFKDPSLHTINKHYCNTIINDYVTVLRQYTGNTIFINNTTCNTSNNTNTWSFTPYNRNIHYPADYNNNKTIWQNYFDAPIWKNRDNIEYIYYWRNILIPAHEIVHAYCRNTATPYYDEWIASIGNLNVFVAHYNHLHSITTDNTLKNIYSLHVIHGVLYVVYLINILRQTVYTINNQDDIKFLDLCDKWTRLQLNNTPDKQIIIHAITNTGWRNTYAKHIAALMYCFAIFNDIDTTAFINDIYSDKVWSEATYLKYKSLIINYDEWISVKPCKTVASWINS